MRIIMIMVATMLSPIHSYGLVLEATEPTKIVAPVRQWVDRKKSSKRRGREV